MELLGMQFTAGTPLLLFQKTILNEEEDNFKMQYAACIIGY